MTDTAQSTTAFHVAGRAIGPDHPPYIIAELSANHNGQLDRALKSIEAAALAGADAVKIQSYTPDTITIDCDAPEFRITEGLWKGHTLYELYQKAYTPFEWHPALFAKAREADITLFSSPFDFTAVDLLESLDTPAYKIASFELVDIPLIQRVASTGKPVILSTGMATLADIELAVDTCRDAGASQIALLHCVSSYPARAEDVNLKTMLDIRDRFDVTIGLSDHSLGNTVATAAVALGACIIEKHFMLDGEDGPDAAFSLVPDDLAALCRETKTAWSSLGGVAYGPQPDEGTSSLHRRSLYIVEDIKAGEPLTPINMRSIRPGTGLPPRYYNELLGKRVKTDLKKGTALDWDCIKY